MAAAPANGGRSGSSSAPPHGGVYVIAEAKSLDELAVELDERGILMWPADGCE